MLAKIFTEGKGTMGWLVGWSILVMALGQSMVDGNRAYECFFFTLIQHIYLGVGQFTFQTSHSYFFTVNTRSIVASRVYHYWSQGIMGEWKPQKRINITPQTDFSLSFLSTENGSQYAVPVQPKPPFHAAHIFTVPATFNGLMLLVLIFSEPANADVFINYFIIIL